MMAGDLQASDFREFFRAVNAHDPFPWQERLVEQVVADGRWPDLLDLPTASGKTAAIDAAVFLHALDPRFPRRIVFVIDRRVVVQQAAERARNLADKLASATEGIVGTVADRLRQKATPDPKDSSRTEPLGWAELRGGIVRDESWTMRPDVPTVIVSTVDQVGSRLLFRGYGVSDRMWSVHAGLLANDALFLLDEVHLSRPFASTLRSIATRYRQFSSFVPDRWQVVELSATPGAPDGRSFFELSGADTDCNLTPVLAKRVSAVKLASKHMVKGRGDRSSVVAKEAADYVLSMCVGQPGMVLGVLVNRVNTARLVAGHLAQPADSIDHYLITGRMRPFDRDSVLRLIEDRVKTGRERLDTGKPLVVVGTQSLEAGADFDFDALVTECASYDALKQRFGRVDRSGDLSQSGQPSKSVILAHPEDIKDRNDPVYGAALAETWDWLPGGEFDFPGLPVDGGKLAKISAPKRDAPVLLPSHLDRWVQTSPVPDADPDVAQWLHGLTDPAPADVSVVWRKDLTPELLATLNEAEVADLVSACRPGSGEQMQVPLTAVRTWLGTDGEQEIAVADVEGVDVKAVGTASTMEIRPVLRWFSDNSTIANQAKDVRPGDTIVVPSVYGGIASKNWAPDSRQPVSDLGHQVQVVQRHTVVLRLSPEFFPPDSGIPLPGMVDADPGALDEKEAIGTWLLAARGLHTDDPLDAKLISWLCEQPELRVHRTAANTLFTVTSPRRLSPPEASRMANPLHEQSESTVEFAPETSSFTGRPVLLADHLRNVADWAGFLALTCGVTELANDLRLAGNLHDLGKADPRFQDILRNDRALDDGLLAKSGQSDLTRSERERIRRKAGYPAGGGHELLSVALIQHVPLTTADAADVDLVLHLVASHHGVCRPFAPVIEDSNPVPVRLPFDGQVLEHSSASGLARLDSGVPERFWRLVRRYGWFGLAYLECLLRLADHRASEQEQRHG